MSYFLKLPLFAYVVMLVAACIIPLISLSYLLLRLPARRKQLTNFFKTRDILPKYLAVRGHLPERSPDISDEAWNKILADEFDRVFDLELNQEYSPALYRVPLLMACAVSVGAAIFLVTAGVHAPILNHVATPVYFAVLGAFIWSLWTLITRYTQNDLMPSTFWRILLGYLLAIAYGLLAKTIFNEAFANVGTFVLATVPYSESLAFVRSRVGSFGFQATASGDRAGLAAIQGLDADTISALEDLGVHNIQQLAYSDLLRLLIKSNFNLGVLVDWMDQAFLYNYVGTKIDALRLRGIRGAIEMATLDAEENGAPHEFLTSTAAALGVTVDELKNLIHNLYEDVQLDLIWEIWDVMPKNPRPAPTPGKTS
jgi:hypothetical protein